MLSPEEKKAHRAVARKSDPERFASYQDKYIANNQTTRKESLDKYYEMHKVEILEKQRAYRLSHPDRRKAACSRWAKNNPDKCNALVQRRRARKAGLDLGFTVLDWSRLKEIFGYRCCYCGSYDRLHQDHFEPLSKGGPHVIWNIVPACMECNSRKNDRPPSEWVIQNFGLKTYQSICTVLQGLKNESTA